jgi:hypothetical protein
LRPVASRRAVVDLGFLLYMSIDDGTSYTLIGSFPNLAPRGTLVAEYSEDNYTIDDDTGFSIDFDFSEDVDNFETITTANALASVANFAILGDELMTVQTITPDAVVDNRYTFTNIYHGRFGTQKATHAAGTEFWLLHADLIYFSDVEALPGVTRKFKFVPYNEVNTGDIAESTVISLSIDGLTLTPYVPVNFMANDGSFFAHYSTDVVLTWDYRKRGVGAGIGAAGVALPDTTIDGLFRIEVWVSGVKVRDASAISAATWIYTSAMNVADNGSAADVILFKLYNYIVINGVTYESDVVEVTCYRDGR